MNPVYSVAVNNPNVGDDEVVSPSGTAHSTNITYVNTSGRTMYVFAGYVWIGVSMGDKGDVSFELFNLTQGIIYLDSNDDHYCDRGGLPENSLSLPTMPSGYAFFVNPGDTIVLGLTGNADAGVPLVAQAYARLYYTWQ